MYPTPPITPSPPEFVFSVSDKQVWHDQGVLNYYSPAFDTAAASGAPDVWPIPANRMGCWIPSSCVIGVEIDIVEIASRGPDQVSRLLAGGRQGQGTK